MEEAHLLEAKKTFSTLVEAILLTKSYYPYCSTFVVIVVLLGRNQADQTFQRAMSRMANKCTLEQEWFGPSGLDQLPCQV